jgi:hypothetical protein
MIRNLLIVPDLRLGEAVLSYGISLTIALLPDIMVDIHASVSPPKDFLTTSSQ